MLELNEKIVSDAFDESLTLFRDNLGKLVTHIPRIIRFRETKARSFAMSVIHVSGDNYIIEYSNLFRYCKDTASQRKLLIEIALHELIHTQPGCWNHQKRFKLFCKALNEKLGSAYHVDTRFRLDYARDYFTPENFKAIFTIKHRQPKFKITCLNCGHAAYYTKRCGAVERTEDYYCGHCGSRKLICSPVVGETNE